MSGRGCTELTRWKLTHEQLTPTEAILAKCADCMAEYEDGHEDCKNYDCPLYMWMPYGTMERPKKHVSDETRQRLSENLKNAREARAKRREESK
jgi:hypothetical protein